MAYRELELSLLSAQELKSVNLMTRMHVYAVVSISGDPLTRQCTEPDPYGGRNPCWNATFRFAVPPTASGASLHVLLRAERLLGDRDVGEVVVPLADILAGATGAGPQPPQVASYQVRKVHRWEPRGVLNVSYRLGPVVAPVVERVPDKAANFSAYAPVGVPQHDEAAQNKSPVMAYPVGVPQQKSHPPAKPDPYRTPTPTPPRPRNATVHEASSAPAPPPMNGLGQPGPTHVYMGPQTQIIFGGAPTSTATSPARSIVSPRSRKEDRWRPSVLSQSHHDTESSSPFSSRSSSFSSSPLSPRPSTTTSPRPPAVSDDAEVATFRRSTSVSPYSSSPLAPVLPKPAISSPLPSVAPSLSTHH
jgi:hypothetical protein